MVLKTIVGHNFARFVKVEGAFMEALKCVTVEPRRAVMADLILSIPEIRVKKAGV